VLKVYSISLGCPKNRVDTERLLGSIGTPVQIVPHLGHAKLIFINTCGFIFPAVQESIRTVVACIKHMGKLKRRPLLAVAGCLVGRYSAKELAKELPEVDIWLPNQELSSWADIVNKALNIENGIEGRLISTPPSYAWLKISDGCQHNCSFCTIPSIRGRLNSTPAHKIIAEAKFLLATGVKELVLIAQDVTAWGQDLEPVNGKKQNLRYLLEQLLELNGLKWLRLLYLYPAGLNHELLTFISQTSDKLLPYFDIPIQHSHSDILALMGRPFANNPRKLIYNIKEMMPHAAIRTSLIVGFPSEIDKHFKDLLAFVQEIKFTQLGVFTYFAEDGTLAAKMPKQVEMATKESRKNIIMQEQQAISAEYLKQYLGASLPILVDAPHPEWPGLYAGRAWFQAPEIDGITYISGQDIHIADMVKAEIVDSYDYDLSALADESE